MHLLVCFISKIGVDNVIKMGKGERKGERRIFLYSKIRLYNFCGFCDVNG